MTHIKSALEIALEKTETIHSDKSALLAAGGRDEGKRLAAAFFENPAMDLAAELTARENSPAVKEGFFQVILARLALPRDKEDIAKLEPLSSALGILLGDRAAAAAIHKQLTQFFGQWLDDKAHLDEAITGQLGPMLRQKEAQLSRQLGRPVRLDPKTDPDYMKAYSTNMGNLENRYGEVLSQVKEDLASRFATAG
jgi:hypothetical protein